MVENEKGQPHSHGGGWDSVGLSQLQRSQLRSKGSQGQAGLSSTEHRSGKRYHTHLAVKISRILSTTGRRESDRDTGTLLEHQSTKSHWQPLNRGSSKGIIEQTRVSWGETGSCGSGERAERRAARVSVLSPSPTLQMSPFLGEALSSLWHQPWGCNSPTFRTPWHSTL